MVKFIYEEFKKSVGLFPLRSFSFVLSFTCTYFILLVSILCIENVLSSFQVLSKNYKASLVLRPDFNELEIKNLEEQLKEYNSSIRLRYINPSMVFRSLKESKIKLKLNEDEIKTLVPALAEISFENMSPIKKVKLTNEIEEAIQRLDSVDQFVAPYPKVQKLVEIYFKSRAGLWLFITALYSCLFVLLFLLLSLLLKEHKKKTDLFKILGFKKNYIRGPLILEGVFLSTTGLIFAVSLLYALCYQVQSEYSEVLHIEFFSFLQILSHILVNTSLVFFLTVLMTQKIIKEDYIEG